MPSNGLASASHERPRPPRREFVTTTGSEDLGRYSGIGLTLDEVIGQELQNVATAIAAAAPVDACDDLVIWERNKVVALIRVDADHRPVVARFDPPPSAPAEPAPAGGEIGQALRSLAADQTRSAIAAFHGASDRAAAAQDRFQAAICNGAPATVSAAEQAQWQAWDQLARDAKAIAGRHLFLCLRALNGWPPRPPDRDDPGPQPPPCGAIAGDRLYVASADVPSVLPLVLDMSQVVGLDPSPAGGSRGPTPPGREPGPTLT
jgi:hypothetical protein